MRKRLEMLELDAVVAELLTEDGDGVPKDVKKSANAVS